MFSIKAPALCLALLSTAIPTAAAAGGWFEGKRYPIVTGAEFPADDFILDQARFWFEIYYLVGEDEGLLHDPFHPQLVLRKVRVPLNPGRASSKAIDAVLAQLRSDLRAAAAKDEASRTPAEKELMSRLPSHWDTTHVQLCAERLRFQRGLKNKFREGVERSYRYLPLIDSVFAAKGLPGRLKYLPHVESSFYPHAYSKVGAAGMWQFMKSSARLFKMKVGYQVDERRDPVASTVAAAAMLANNNNRLESWPLALVAYNHGPGGLAKAARVTGTRDLTTIIKSYYSESFGFASKNFYAEFLAASSIALKADSLYPNLAKMEPLRFQKLALPKAIATRQLCALTGLSAADLEEYNLGLRPATFRSNAQLPKGQMINLPVHLDLVAVATRLGAGAAVLASLSPASGKAAPASSTSAVTLASGTAEASPAAESPADPALASAAATVPADKVGAVSASQPVPGPEGSAAAKAPASGKPAAGFAAAAGSSSPKVPDLSQPSAGAKGKPGSAKPAQVLASGELRAAGPAPSRVSSAPAQPASEAGRTVPASEGDAAGKPPVPMAVAVATQPPRKESSPLSAALPKPSQPAPVPAAAASEAPRTASATASPVPDGAGVVVDSTFALQVSGMDKLAHPMDRFNPAIYNLGHEYAKGHLVIQVGTEETLSHYAEWAWIPERTLRKLNRIRTARDLRMGRSIRIPIPEDKAPEFLSKREEYYRAMEEDFYGNYFVSAVEPIVVKKGMSLWGLVHEKEIPFWLLQKHNPGKLLGEVRPGDTLSMPQIETGIRKWGFTRYGNSREYLAGITRFILSGDSP